MLKILRKKGVAKKILWVIAVVIILSFGFFGTATLLNDKPDEYAGKVFGKKISLDEFGKIYEQVRIQTMIQYGENFEKVREFLNLENETWNRLILLREANKHKIKVSDEEVVAYAQSFPFFERGGAFDATLYETILNHVFRVKPRAFEESLRDQLKIQKLFDQKTSTVTVTDEELFEEFRKVNEKAQVSYVLVSPEQFKSEVAYTEDELLAYFENNKAEFLMPPSIKAAYISLPLKELLADPNDPIAADQIRQENETARQTAYEIYQKLLQAPDLSKTAASYNLPVTTTNYFSLDNPDFSLGWSYDLLNALFNMPQGQIAEPFESEKSVQIIQLQEKKDAYIPDFDVAKNKIIDAVLLQKAQQIARGKAEEYLNAVKEEMDKTMLHDFDKAAKTLGLEIQQTPLFGREQYLPQIGLSKAFQDEAFALTEINKISPIVKTSVGYCFLHLDHFEPANQSDFEEQKTTLKEQLLTRKKNELFIGVITELRNNARLEDRVTRRK